MLLRLKPRPRRPRPPLSARPLGRLEVLRFHFLLDSDPEPPNSWKSDSGSRAGIKTPIYRFMVQGWLTIVMPPLSLDRVDYSWNPSKMWQMKLWKFFWCKIVLVTWWLKDREKWRKKQILIHQILGIRISVLSCHVTSTIMLQKNSNRFIFHIFEVFTYQIILSKDKGAKLLTP